MAVPSTRTRRVVLHLLVALVACGQLWSALELAGVKLPAPYSVLTVEGILVLLAVGAAWRRPGEPAELARWSFVGPAMWVIWGTCYFGAARITDPPNARTFDDALLQKLPLLPSFTAIYLGVHVFSMIPYCVLPEARLLRRYLLGNMLIVLLSAIAWVTLPVRLDRPPFEPGNDFGSWLLTGVYRFDPTTNCFPSAHCAVAVYSAIALRIASRRLFAWGIFSAVAICVSTVMTKQHYVADVAGGAVLAALAAYAMRRRPVRMPDSIRTLEPPPSSARELARHDPDSERGQRADDRRT
jgi:membrane-associated phospholipid phosphatase